MYRNRMLLPKLCVRSGGSYIFLSLASIKYFDTRSALTFCTTSNGIKYFIESDRISICSNELFRDFICVEERFLINPMHTRSFLNRGDRWLVHFVDGEKLSILKSKMISTESQTFNTVRAFF
jgi:hypothetical protein